MRLVDNDGIVLVKKVIPGKFSQQDTVGHDFNQRSAVGVIGESYLVSDQRPRLRSQFLGQSLGHGSGGKSARLGMADEPASAASGLKTDLRQLGGFTGTGGAGDHHYPVVYDCIPDFILLLHDWQFFGIAQLRYRLLAFEIFFIGGFCFKLQFGQRLKI